jgi:hypothetical protein
VERSASASQPVWREVRDTTVPAGAGDRHAQVRVRNAGRERFCRVAVLMRRQRRHECGEEVIRQVEVAIPLVLLGVGPDPNRLSLFIDIPDDGHLELGDARLARVEDEKGED